MQGVQVQSLVGKLDPSCLGKKKKKIKQEQCHKFNKNFKNVHIQKNLKKEIFFIEIQRRQNTNDLEIRSGMSRYLLNIIYHFSGGL